MTPGETAQTYNGKAMSCFYPLRISDHNEKRPIVDLLLIANQDTQHFVLVRKISGLLYGRVKNKNAKFYCRRCLRGCYSAEILARHKSHCNTIPAQKVIMPDDKTKLKFSALGKTVRHPLFISKFRYIYKYIIITVFIFHQWFGGSVFKQIKLYQIQTGADFECILEPCENSDEAGATKNIQNHIPIGFGIQLVSDFEDGGYRAWYRLVRIKIYIYIFFEKNLGTY